MIKSLSSSQVIWNRTNKLCFMVFKDWHQKRFAKDPKTEETPQATAVEIVICLFFPFHEISVYFTQCFVRLSFSFSGRCMLRLTCLSHPFLASDVPIFQRRVTMTLIK